MLAPFPLYVDEISADKTKAVVSNSSSVFYNIKTMSLDMPPPTGRHLFNITNGTFIMPVGRFICMLIRNHGHSSMIILDLIDKDELAQKMAEKLQDVNLQDQFMQVYTEVVSHPEKHSRFKLVVGNTPVEKSAFLL